MKIVKLLVVAVVTALNSPAAVTVSPLELARKSDWVQQNLLTPTNLPPFSFNYRGISSSALLPTWVRTQSDTVLAANRTQHILTWTQAGYPFQVQCVAVEYSDFPVVEWTVCLTNSSSSYSGTLQNIQGLDTTFSRGTGPEFVLNGNQGDFTTADSYQPFQYELGPNATRSFAPPGSGKSSDGANGWPYWNLQMPGGGVILAVGWPGQWASSFTRDAADSLRVQAGQQLTSLQLQPGERIRTPSLTLLFWQGTDLVRAQNLWRRFYRAHILPPGSSSILQIQGDNMTVVNAYLQAGIRPDILWLDAGWYPTSQGPYTGADAWLNTGTWVPNPFRYPSGFKLLSDRLHDNGMKFLLWFEPERVGSATNSWLGTNHADWLLQPGSVGLILDEGNPAAFNWLTNYFDEFIKSNGVDWYREDMNGGGPCPSWRAHDASYRQGITENFYVQGHLAYWDALRAMNPSLRIDSCASGGRRNDLETMRRAVPLLRSDFVMPAMANVVDGNQCHTHALSSWLPFHGSGCFLFDVYSFRSFYLPSFGMAYGLTPANTAAQQQAYAECKKVAPCMLFGDYYPLTPYSLSDTVWMAWQFDRPDTGEGVVQVFRRANSPAASMQVRWQGLNATQSYVVQDFDRGALGYFTGNQLMATGLLVQLSPAQSAILYYSTPLAVSASASSQSGFAPLTVQFAATAVSTNVQPPTFSWTFGDGGGSTNQNPTHTYTAGGRYVAQVTVQDGNGNTANAQLSVTVFGASRKMKLSFPGYDRGEVLTRFPALVVLGTNLTANGFAYDQVASSNGWDLLFLDSTETQELPYEIESWNTNGSSHVWVRLPQLATDTSIWAYWGDTNLASAPAPCLGDGSVWANGYVGVWHLTDGTTLSAKDSSSNDWPGVVGSGSTAASGVVDGGGNFHGTINDYVGVGTINPLPDGTGTVSAWVNLSPSSLGQNNYALAKGDDNGTVSWGLDLIPGTASCNLALLYGGARWAQATVGRAVTNSWHMFCAVMQPNAQQLFFDGVLLATNNLSTITPAAGSQFYIGKTQRAAPYAYAFNGTLDEARVATAGRGSNWVWAEWMTVASNAVFASYGPVLDNSAWPFKVTQMTLLPGNQFAVVWQTAAGRFYTVESNTNLLSAGAWNPVATNLSGSGGVGSWTGQVSQATEFLRVRVQ